MEDSNEIVLDSNNEIDVYTTAPKLLPEQDKKQKERGIRGRKKKCSERTRRETSEEGV